MDNTSIKDIEIKKILSEEDKHGLNEFHHGFLGCFDTDLFGLNYTPIYNRAWKQFLCDIRFKYMSLDDETKKQINILISKKVLDMSLIGTEYDLKEKNSLNGELEKIRGERDNKLIESANSYIAKIKGLIKV